MRLPFFVSNRQPASSILVSDCIRSGLTVDFPLRSSLFYYDTYEAAFLAENSQSLVLLKGIVRALWQGRFPAHLPMLTCAHFEIQGAIDIGPHLHFCCSSLFRHLGQLHSVRVYANKYREYGKPLKNCIPVLGDKPLKFYRVGSVFPKRDCCPFKRTSDFELSASENSYE